MGNRTPKLSTVPRLTALQIAAEIHTIQDHELSWERVPLKNHASLLKHCWTILYTYPGYPAIDQIRTLINDSSLLVVDCKARTVKNITRLKEKQKLIKIDPIEDQIKRLISLSWNFAIRPFCIWCFFIKIVNRLRYNNYGRITEYFNLASRLNRLILVFFAPRDTSRIMGYTVEGTAQGVQQSSPSAFGRRRQQQTAQNTTKTPKTTQERPGKLTLFIFVTLRITFSIQICKTQYFIGHFSRSIGFSIKPL